MVTVNAIKCPNCGDTIYSRAHHDMRWCTCKETAIDGGFDYLKICAKDVANIKSFKLDVDADKKTLYDDWNKRKDKYGLIKEKK